MYDFRTISAATCHIHFILNYAVQELAGKLSQYNDMIDFLEKKKNQKKKYFLSIMSIVFDRK